MSNYHRDETDKLAMLVQGGESLVIPRPDPCLLASKRNPEIALFLSLNCPRCGQLASLDGDREDQGCLAQNRPSCQFQLSGDHHDFRQ